MSHISFHLLLGVFNIGVVVLCQKLKGLKYFYIFFFQIKTPHTISNNCIQTFTFSNINLVQIRCSINISVTLCTDIGHSITNMIKKLISGRKRSLWGHQKWGHDKGKGNEPLPSIMSHL
uniref:Uncharacterized protein n=1 Tax=Gouania willdenowi TaxID=441366 RepID=A0A8C5GBH9_GOUWI